MGEESDDLVERLRTFDIYDYADADKICRKAAARIAELEAALQDMAKHVWRGDWDKLKPETRALLSGGKDGPT